MSRVSSPALIRWNDERCAALDSLVAIHGKVVGGKRGRRYATRHLNRALFVALASEFQGYCRDLHDNAVFVMTDGFEPSSDLRLPILRNALVRGRKLDTGNAQPASLGSDFNVIGMDFWPAVERAYPTKKVRWQTFLTKLNDTRNAIVHRQDVKLAALDEPLTLATFRRWRSPLNGVVVVVDAYLQDTAGKSW